MRFFTKPVSEKKNKEKEIDNEMLEINAALREAEKRNAYTWKQIFEKLLVVLCMLGVFALIGWMISPASNSCNKAC